MLTSKQRAQLRGMANSIDTIVTIGKDGITDPVVKQADDALVARELIKCRVLDNSMLTAREACDQMAVMTKAELVQVIGTRFVLYRENKDKDKDKKIELCDNNKKTRGPRGRAEIADKRVQSRNEQGKKMKK